MPAARRWRWPLGIAAVVVLAALGGYAGWKAYDAWSVRQTLQPLTGLERAALDGCEDPGWRGLQRILVQDLPDGCGVDWFATTAQPHLEGRGQRRRGWLRAITQDSDRSARVRFRAGSALLVSGEPAPPDLAVWTRDPSLRGERPRLAALIAEAHWPETWADPALQGDAVALGRDLPDGELRTALVAHLRRTAAVAEAGVEEDRARLGRHGLEWAGLGQGVLEEALARRATGRALQGVPPDAAQMVFNEGQRCLEPGAITCLRWLAEILESQGEPLPAEATEGLELPAPLWVVRFPGRATERAERRDVLGAMARWIAEAPPEDQAVRLLAVVHGGSVSDPAAIASPMTVVHHHRGPPWTVALTALALGRAAGVPVTVWAEGHGVRIRAGEEVLRLDACGERLDPEVGGVSGPGWPAAAVVAQAAVELSGAASRAGEADLAERALRMAHRLDPVGTLGLGGGSEQAGPAAEAAAVLHLAAPVPDAAWEARRERARALLTGQAGVPCPALP
jgi:hypothetical protein